MLDTAHSRTPCLSPRLQIQKEAARGEVVAEVEEEEEREEKEEGGGGRIVMAHMRRQWIENDKLQPRVESKINE